MDRAPAIEDVQEQINHHWREIKQRTDDPPSVLRTLVFCTDDGVLEALSLSLIAMGVNYAQNLTGLAIGK